MNIRGRGPLEKLHFFELEHFWVYVSRLAEERTVTLRFDRLYSESIQPVMEEHWVENVRLKVRSFYLPSLFWSGGISGLDEGRLGALTVVGADVVFGM